MAGGLFSRVKTWLQNETLTRDGFVAELDWIISNLKPSMIDDYSASLAEYRTQTAPGGVGTESFSTNMAGDWARLRYVIARITGKTYWYQAPDGDLTTRSQGLVSWYLPFDDGQSSLEYALSDTVNRGAIINVENFAAQSLNTADFTNVTGETKFPGLFNSGYAFTMGAGNFLAYPAKHDKLTNFTIAAHIRDGFPNDYVAFNPVNGTSLHFDGSGKLKLTFRKSTATASETSKDSVTVTSTAPRTGILEYHHVAASFVLNSSNGSVKDSATLFYDGVSEGTALENTTLTGNLSHGSHWFVGCKPQDPAWDRFSSMKVEPHSEANVVNPFSKRASGGTSNVSNGILTMTNTASTNYVHYDADIAVNFAAMTIETKMRVSKETRATVLHGQSPAAIFLRNNTDNRSLGIWFYPGRIVLADSLAENGCMSTATAGSMATSKTAAATISNTKVIQHNFTEWSVVRFVFTGSAAQSTCHVFINGISMGKIRIGRDDTTASNYFGFGMGLGSGVGVFEMEWFAHVNGTSSVPIVADTQGQLDDVVCTRGTISTTNIASLSTTIVPSVIGDQGKNGITLHNPYFQWNAMSGRDSIAAFNNTNDAATEQDILQFWPFIDATYAPTHINSEDGRLYFPSDGRTRITFNAQVGASTNGAASFLGTGLFVNGQGWLDTNAAGGIGRKMRAVFNDAATAAIMESSGYQQAAALNKSLILPVGLHYVSIGFSTSGTVNFWVEPDTNITASIA